MYLRGDAGEPVRPEFALSGPSPATWLESGRIVADVPVGGPSTTVRQAVASGSGGLAALSAPPTSAAPSPPPPPTTPTTVVVAATAVPTTLPVPSSAPATTAAVRAAAPTTAAPLAPTTTTTPRAPTTTTIAVALPALPPAPVTPAQKPFGTHSARGVASWFNAPDGTCAHTSIPVGTVVRVTRLSNGAATTCVVDQWGPADTSRIIDLSMDTFEKLAATEAGLIDVLIEW